MSTITRTLRNLWRIGLKEYGHQMQHIGDTKAGVLIGIDRFGNKYFENDKEELPLRTRWVDYKAYYEDADQIDPGWHAWLHYMMDKPPTADVLLKIRENPWTITTPVPNPTLTRGAYKPYSTVRPKVESWTTHAKPRQ